MDTGISPAMAAELIVRGIDPRPTTSHMLGRRVERTDLILAMDQGVYQMVARRHPRVTDRLFTLGQFASLMDECVTGLSPTHLIEQAMAVSEEPGRVFDVPDPSSQSREQVAICAHIIEDYVDLLLDALGLAHRARRGLVEAA